MMPENIIKLQDLSVGDIRDEDENFRFFPLTFNSMGVPVEKQCFQQCRQLGHGGAKNKCVQ